MHKYLKRAVEFAQYFGQINTVHMTEADKWSPPTIDLCGKTDGGKSFRITLCVGDKLPEAEKEEAGNAETVQ